MREGIHHNQLLHKAMQPEIAADPGDRQHFHHQTYSIEMKKFLIKSSIAGLSILAFGAAHAQSATSARITFTGRITNTTCSVILADRDQTIDFGTVPGNSTGFTGNANAAGDTALPAYERPIQITLENCSAPGQNQQPSSALVSVAGSNVLPAGRLSTGHTNLHIQLLEADPASPNNYIPWNIANASRPINLSAGTSTLRFRARYYVASNASLAPGQANSEAIFNISYQ